MVALVNWVTGTNGTKHSLTLQVDPWVLDDSVRTMQLQILLSMALGTNQVSPNGGPGDPPYSVRVSRGQEDPEQSGFTWATQEELTKTLVELVKLPLVVVRPATADMVVQVVGTSPKPFTNQVCWIIQKYIGPDVAPNVYAAEQPGVYKNRVIELLVPQLDLPAAEGGIPYEEFVTKLRKLFDFRPYLR